MLNWLDGPKVSNVLTIYLIAAFIVQIAIIYMYPFELHKNPMDLAMQKYYSHFTEE